MQLGGNSMAGDDTVGGGGGGEIDLGEPGMGAGMDQPQGAAPAPPSEPSYPSVMLSGGPELSKIPDKGRSLFHHEVTSRKVHTPQYGPHKGKQRHEIEMKLKKVKPMRGYKKAASKSKKSDDEEAMESALQNLPASGGGM